MLRRIIVLAALFIVAGGAAPVAAGGGGGCVGPVTDGAGPAVSISSFCFSPMVVRVEPGTTVTWTNADSAEHNVYSSSFNGRAIPFTSGESYEIKFDEAGVFPYVCTIHPGMTGAVVVGDADVPTAAAPVPATETQAVPAAAPSSDFEQRLVALEQLAADGTLLAASAAPASTGSDSSWPPLAIGLLGGLVIGSLVLRRKQAG